MSKDIKNKLIWRILPFGRAGIKSVRNYIFEPSDFAADKFHKIRRWNCLFLKRKPC